MAVGTEHGERADEQPAVVELRNISKQFGSNRALDAVDVVLHRGEVVALVGQNGSGKSTLVKVLSGFHAPEPGSQLLVGGRDIPLPLEPGKAGEIGFSFVYQNLALAAGITVLENLNLGTRVTGGKLAPFGPIAWRRERREAAAVLRRYRVDLDPSQLTGELAPVDQARLAIVRAAEELRRYRERTGDTHSLLVLDEPTVFLPEEDIQFLFDLVRAVVAEGAAVLFISHDLVAIREIADRIVVLRDGKRVADVPASEVDEDALVDLIVGVSARAAALAAQAQAARPGAGAAGPTPGPTPGPTAGPTPGQPAGRPTGVAAATAPAAGEAPPVARPAGRAAGGEAAGGEAAFAVERMAGDRLRDLSFSLAPGEILGIAGLIGSGAEDVPYLLFGSGAATGGTLAIGGEQLRLSQLTPERAVRKRVALVPADRGLLGLSAPLTVWENMTMLIEDDHFRQGVFHRRELVDIAEQGIVEFNVRPPRVDVAAGTLSGGNQQKVVVAKWLLAKPRLLVLHEPTQGVDVGARRDIYRFVRTAAAAEGMSVVWVTTEFGELAEVCDRVLVICQGRQLAELGGEGLDEDEISAAVLRQFEEV